MCTGGKGSPGKQMENSKQKKSTTKSKGSRPQSQTVENINHQVKSTSVLTALRELCF